MEYRKKKRRCKISEEPEIESTNSPLMKSLVNLMVGISKEKLVFPLEETVIFFVCFSKKLERRDYRQGYLFKLGPLIFEEIGRGDLIFYRPMYDMLTKRQRVGRGVKM
jgi:hypothetical protein